jgi:hypothetical protein
MLRRIVRASPRFLALAITCAASLATSQSPDCPEVSGFTKRFVAHTECSTGTTYDGEVTLERSPDICEVFPTSVEESKAARLPYSGWMDSNDGRLDFYGNVDLGDGDEYTHCRGSWAVGASPMSLQCTSSDSDKRCSIRLTEAAEE